MPKHSTPDASARDNLIGGRGTWTVILLITALLVLFVGIVNWHEQMESRQRDEELRREANPTAAAQECESHLRNRYLNDVEIGSKEVQDEGGLRHSVILYYSHRPADSSARKESLVWCDLEYRGWSGWRLIDSRGL